MTHFVTQGGTRRDKIFCNVLILPTFVTHDRTRQGNIFCTTFNVTKITIFCLTQKMVQQAVYTFFKDGNLKENTRLYE